MTDHLTDAMEAMLALQRNRLFWLSRSDEMAAQIRQWKAEDEAEGCPWDTGAMPSAPALALRVGPISVVPPLRASIRIAENDQ